MHPRVHLLFIDAYDSFSNNIISLLEHLECRVNVLKIDEPSGLPPLASFDAVVIGPGPGHPANAADVGLIPKLWKLLQASPIPTLGICLGFQSLGVTFGAGLERLRLPRHGIVDPVQHAGQHFYQGNGRITVTSYHSLHVPEASLPDCLEPLAYIDDPVNGRVLAAMRHTSLPFWGVQYHPESVCSDDGNRRVLQAWLASCHRRCSPASIIPEASASKCDSNMWSELAQALPQAGPSTWRVVEGTPNLASLSAPDTVLLESQKGGRYSIFGYPSCIADYSDDRLHINSVSAQCTVKQVWDVLGQLAEGAAASNGSSSRPEIPFWGGWMGYATYEAGLQTLGIQAAGSGMRFAWVERSIVIDHQQRLTYIQSIRANDDNWISSFALPPCASSSSSSSSSFSTSKQVRGTAKQPSEQAYRQAVLRCQEYLCAGDSYELCLTDQTRVESTATPLDIYRSLRHTNPAPYGALLRLGSTVLLSSSPERFLRWTRDGHCSLKPIKGTVQKSRKSYEEACAVLGSTKERAENLMILDLIRHDLHSVCGDVAVPSLMQVEEYETVYQLVSEITGTGRGTDVLAVALPPGSMTGAPKLRSCEILQSLESKPRGVYSGVCGYIDIGGGGDFSVVIRSIFTQEYDAGKESTEWRIGAGGAITALSEDKAEFEEMQAKLDSALSAFDLAH